jgi:flagellar biosynthesis protein FlhB
LTHHLTTRSAKPAQWYGDACNTDPDPFNVAHALQYERGINAPGCVATGVDPIARKIGEVAEAHDILVIENPPLTRAFHGTVEIDQEIPQEHYRAVAEIIGDVMWLRRTVPRQSRWSMILSENRVLLFRIML